MSNQSVPVPYLPDWLLPTRSASGRPLCWGSALDEAYLLQYLREDEPGALHLYLDIIDPRLSLKIAHQMEPLRQHARGVQIGRRDMKQRPPMPWRYNHPLEIGPEIEMAGQLAKPLPALDAKMAFHLAGGSQHFVPDPVKESVPNGGARPVLASLLLHGPVESVMFALQMLAVGMVRGIVFQHMSHEQVAELEAMEVLAAIHADNLKERHISNTETTP